MKPHLHQRRVSSDTSSVCGAFLCVAGRFTCTPVSSFIAAVGTHVQHVRTQKERYTQHPCHVSLAWVYLHGASTSMPLLISSMSTTSSRPVPAARVKEVMPKALTFPPRAPLRRRSPATPACDCDCTYFLIRVRLVSLLCSQRCGMCVP